MVIQFEYFFFLINRQNGECYVRNFRLFFFGMSLDVPAIKFHIFTSDFKFWIGVTEYYSSRHSNSNFAHSFDFHCLTNFAKNIGLSLMVSLWREFLCKLSIYNLQSDQWITIWWAKFKLECFLLINIHLLQFKIQSHLQKRGLWKPVYQNSYRRGGSISFTYNITVAIYIRYLS